MADTKRIDLGDGILLTENEVKNIIMYEVSASVMYECFQYARPILRNIEEGRKFASRKHKKEALKQFDKGVIQLQKNLKGCTRILERTNSSQLQESMDQIFELMGKIITVDVN